MFKILILNYRDEKQ